MDNQQSISSFISIDSTVSLHSSDLSDCLFPRQTKVSVIIRNCTNSNILISNAAVFDHPLTTTTTSTSLPASTPPVIHLSLKYINCSCSFFKAISISGESSQPRDQTWVSCISRWILYHWATRDALQGRRACQLRSNTWNFEWEEKRHLSQAPLNSFSSRLSWDRE